MFVRSVRMSTLKFASIAALAFLAIAALILFIPSYESPAPAAKIESVGEEIRFDRIRDAGDRVQFLSQFGYVVDETPVEECEVLIPKEFDRVFAAYNELQKSEGLDLSRYKGKKMMRYTYNVTNYEGYNDPVYANILVYKNKVVGGDVCSADPNGFAHGLTKS